MDPDDDLIWEELCSCYGHGCEDCQGHGVLSHPHDETSRPRIDDDMDEDEDERTNSQTHRSA